MAYFNNFCTMSKVFVILSTSNERDSNNAWNVEGVGKDAKKGKR